MWTYNYAGYSDELYHHGVLGMKWGHRKAVSGSAIGNRMLAANARGAAKVYGKLGNHALASIQSSQAKQYSKKADAAQAKADARASDPKHKADVARKVKIGAAVAGTALAAYGAYKISKMVKEKAVEKGQNHVAHLLDKNGIADPILRVKALDARYNADKKMSFGAAAARAFNKASYNYGMMP